MKELYLKEGCAIFNGVYNMKFEDWTAEQISNFMPRQNFVNKYFFKFDKIKPCRFKDRNGVVVALFFRGCYIIEDSWSEIFGSCSFLSLLWQDSNHLCGTEFYCAKEALKDFYENFIFNDDLSFQQNNLFENDGKLKYFYDLDSKGIVFNRRVRYC